MLSALRPASAPDTCTSDFHSHGSASCSSDALLGWALGQPGGTKIAGHCCVMEEARTGCQKTELLAAQSCEDPKQPRIPFYWISQTRANEHGRRRKKRRGSKRSCFLLKLESWKFKQGGENSPLGFLVPQWQASFSFCYLVLGIAGESGHTQLCYKERGEMIPGLFQLWNPTGKPGSSRR